MSDPLKTQPSLRVGFLLLDRFTLTAFGGFIDALRLAADDGGQSRQIHAAWQIMTPGRTRCQASCGLEVSGSSDFLDPAQFDYIAVCGGNSYLDERLDPAVNRYLHDAYESGLRLLGVCTGTFAIARAGLATGRTVCVHWNVRDAFERQFPLVRTSVDRIFIDEGDIITCAGSTAAIDLGLYLVQRHCSRERARQAMRHMMLASMRAPSLPQPHFQMEIPDTNDLRFRKAVHFMEQQLDHPTSVQAIARYVGISVRQLERTFRNVTGVTPMKYHRSMKLNYGRWMIDNKTKSITQIALDLGFADGAHFSREFRSQFGIAPTSYRKTLVV